jgi:Family of unknown function (DUF5694)
VLPQGLISHSSLQWLVASGSSSRHCNWSLIYTNVIRLVDSPNERILIIYGAGHLAWLRRNFSSDPTVQLRKLAEFANYAGVSK